MTKDDLKNQILGLDLDKDMEKALLQMVAESEDVNADLLEAMADILEDQADLDEEAAGYYQTVAEELEMLASKVEGTRDDYLADREEISAELSELLSDDLTAVAEKVKNHVSLGAGAAM